MNIIIILYFGIISPVGYVLTVKDITTQEIMYIVAITHSAVHINIFLPTVTGSYERQLKTILKCIDHEFNFDQVSANFISMIGRSKYESLSLGIKWFASLIILYVPFALSSFVYAIIFCDQSNLNDLQLYLMALPYMDRIHSYVVYVCTQMFTLYIGTFVFLGGCSIVIFPAMIGWEFHNAYLNICVHLHNVIQKTVLHLEAVRKKRVTKLYFSSGPVKYNMGTNEYEVFLEFKKELGSVIEHHQLLCRYGNNTLF